ncbi:MAG: type II toxin-antitoxin system RelE/ParE family toxin [Bacteroidia bacterium]|nr:type II toxin-antitoxin system RelE/ParE family toxin [Bacteroidia bacterium]
MLEVKGEALKDIEWVVEWYEMQQTELGRRFYAMVLDNFKYLILFPLSQQKKYKENRELLLEKFPYVIVYRVVSPSSVIVLAVVHCKHHPSKRKMKHP